MAWSIGLFIGNFFSEATASASDGKVIQNQWFHGPGQWSTGLSSFLTQNQIPPAEVTLSILCPGLTGFEMDPEQFSGAFLTTAGFEHWMNFTGTQAPFSSDRVFGVLERKNPRGETVTELSATDLDFLAAKFELMKTANISIGFLNSQANPEHERNTTSFFQERKFALVQDSHDLPSGREGRWFQAALTTAGHYFEELIRQTLAKLELHQARIQIGPHLWHQLREKALKELKAEAKCSWLYWGLENFLFVSKDVESNPILRSLTISPTTEIIQGPLGLCTWGENRSWAPGPLFTGRGRNALLMDLLFLVSGVDPSKLGIPQSPKGGMRINDTLRLLESDVSRSPVAPATPLTERLVESALDRIMWEVEEGLHLGPLVFSGPLAPWWHQKIQARLGTSKLLHLDPEPFRISRLAPTQVTKEGAS